VSDSALARIVRLVEQAQAQKAPSERFVDRFARIYTPAVITVAAGIATIPPLVAGADLVTWIYRALVLLVIACPCALVISTPVAIVSALGRAARNGVLIKGGTYLEAAGSLNAIAFDKTRTLTVGQPVVTDVIPLNGQSEDEVLALAAAMERNSEHPLAQAVVRAAGHRGLFPAPAVGFQALPGRGARARVDGSTLMIGNRALLGECLSFPPETDDLLLRLEEQGKTVFILGRCGDDGEGMPRELIGAIAVADTVRAQSPDAIRELREEGLQHIVMITGDNLATAGAIGRQVGLDEIRANLLPEQKVAVVEGLLQDYGAVAVVGDGVNDAPALARATVGIAMGAAGTDAALETADIALMGDDLTKVPFTLRLSRRTLGIIRQNIAFSLLIKALFVALAVVGIATLWGAVFADVGTSLIVILNGMRAGRR
jgi:Cd2+/Zn2+-exporting ATPase